MSENVQYMITGIIIVLAAIYLYKHFKSGENCSDCELKDACNKKRNKYKKQSPKH